MQLIERADELAAIDEALRSARTGVGSVTLVEGPPGIGKTELLTAAIARARRQGMLVLSARGAELELAVAHAVVRQLFEPAVTRAERSFRRGVLAGAAAHAATVVDPRAQPRATQVDPSSVLHGLYWLTANLAADQPVLLVVDDLHWTDPASVSWLGYLARRIDGLSVALMLAARPFEPGADNGLLERLRATEGLRRVTPAPLSLAAVDGLASAALGEPADAAFSEACHGATGGNPFYVVELLRALRQHRAAGKAAGTIDALTPTAVVDATLARLGRMPSEARSVAEAVALLEPNAELRWIAELTGLDVDAVAAAADSLLALGMLRSVQPCRFEHPILRSAVESETPPARRGRLHLEAARALAAAGLPVEMVAAHLMQAASSGEPWVIAALQHAAARARARGAPDGAVAYLERALAERPARHLRRELLLALGTAESQLQRPQAANHLREALALAEDAQHAAATAFALGHALFNAGAFDEGYEAVGEAVARAEGHEGQRTLELEAFLLTLAVPAGRMAETAERAAALEIRTPRGSPAAGAVQACLALREMAAGHPRARVRERAERAARLGRGLGSGAPVLGGGRPGMAFLWTDDLDRAEQLFSEGIEASSRLGKLGTFENFSALRGYTVRRRGDLADAAADIEPVLAGASEGGVPGAATLLALTTQVLLLIDHDKPEAAGALTSVAPVLPAFERLPLVALLRLAEAAALLARGRFGEAVAALTRVGDVCEANGVRAPALFPWRSQLALALAGTERHDEGIELARAELRLGDACDVNRARGVALRVLALLEGGQAGLRGLEASVQAFERSPARLELGWASYELGAALRRAASRREARVPLDRALDIALACGAQRLARHAGEELQALGARPRSVMLSGAESLTPSERRVCRLAAGGLKNGEIAQALFVTLKTVETHLRSSFRKLDISSRNELRGALGSATAAGRAAA